MYLNDYETTLKWLDGKLLRESSYDSAQILVGDDIITTFNGIEAARHRPNNSVQFTVGDTRGLRWIRQFGAVCGFAHTRLKAWNGGAEKHYVLYDKGGKETRTTGKFEIDIVKDVSGCYINHVAKNLRVYHDWRPRTKVLTAKGQAHLKEYIGKMIDQAEHDFGIIKLKGVEVNPHAWGSVYNLMHQLKNNGKPGFSTTNNHYGFRDVAHLKTFISRAKYEIADFIEAEVEYRS